MNRLNVITHQKKELLFIDFSNASPEECLQLIKSAGQHIRSQPKLSVLALTNTTDARFNSEVRKEMINYVKNNKPYVKASAVVGVTGLQEIILNGIIMITKRKFKLCDTIQEAKDWLVSV